MKSNIVKLVGFTALFATSMATAETVEAGASSPLQWGEAENRLTNTKFADLVGDILLDCDAGGPFEYSCRTASARSSNGTSVKTIMTLFGADPFNPYTQTTRISASFDVSVSNDLGRTIQASVSGLIKSSGTIAADIKALEGWVDFSVKVEIYKISADGLLDPTLIAGADVISENCAGVLAQVGLIEPCRTVFSNDIPVSIPLLLTQGSEYEIVVTSSCSVQGPGVGCYGPVFTDFSKGLETELINFIVSVSTDELVTDLTRASQSSADELLEKVKALEVIVADNQSLIIELQASVSELLTKVDDNQATNQANFEELKRLVKLPLGQRKK